MTTALILSKEELAHLEKMDAVFKAEFDSNPTFRKEFTLTSYIAMRRIDEGLAVLAPTSLSATEAEANWMASGLGTDPVLSENPRNFLN